MKQYNSWDEIDKDTGGLVTSLTYIVLFVNDQVYNFEMQLPITSRDADFIAKRSKCWSTAWTAKWPHTIGKYAEPQV